MNEKVSVAGMQAGAITGRVNFEHAHTSEEPELQLSDPALAFLRVSQKTGEVSHTLPKYDYQGCLYMICPHSARRTILIECLGTFSKYLW